MSRQWVITRTPTIGDGIVYRWYLSESAARWSENPTVTASRNRVTVDSEFHNQDGYDDLTAALTVAFNAMLGLSRGLDPQYLVTHEGGGLFDKGEFHAIKREASDA